VTWRRPNDGIVLWLSLPKVLDPERVYEEALRHGVVVSPSTVWSVGGDAERGIRLAFCAEPADRLVEGAKRLGKAVKGLLARAPRESGNAPALMEVV
jgi:DNA-binding transcriptional MocR family regulator